MSITISPRHKLPHPLLQRGMPMRIRSRFRSLSAQVWRYMTQSCYVVWMRSNESTLPCMYTLVGRVRTPPWPHPFLLPTSGRYGGIKKKGSAPIFRTAHWTEIGSNLCFLTNFRNNWIPVLCHYGGCDCGKIPFVLTLTDVFVLRSRLAVGIRSLRCLCRVLRIFRCFGQNPRASISETMPSEHAMSYPASTRSELTEAVVVNSCSLVEQTQPKRTGAAPEAWYADNALSFPLSLSLTR
jgi:hypothetical protein